ncbi:hypothetical protein [Mycolicibacterium sp. HS_4_1]
MDVEGPDLRRFLVEWYRHESGAAPISETEGRLRSGAAAVSASGAPIHLEIALSLPTDDYAFCVFAAESVDAVRQLCLDAGAPPDRISAAEVWPRDREW